MSETKQARAARHKVILEKLDAPGGRERTDADIAAEMGCSARSVRYVRRAHPTPEEMARSMKALDSVFPGIYQWHMDTQARKAEHHAPDGLGVNSPNFGRLARIEEDL